MDTDWQRILSKEQFVELFADKTLLGDDLRFVIHASGKISGQAGGRDFHGDWYWENGFFCRTATIDGQALELDCEIIEFSGNQMRYTKEKGKGASAIVSIERLQAE